MIHFLNSQLLHLNDLLYECKKKNSIWPLLGLAYLFFFFLSMQETFKISLKNYLKETNELLYVCSQARPCLYCHCALSGPFQ